ncbi:MAG: RNA polymerase sigma factor [Patescibacteria group bacterium]
MNLFEQTAQCDLSDDEILRKSIDNPALFGIIVDRYQAAFVGKARNIVRSQEEAEDIAQETFTKIYVNAGKFEKLPGIEFKSWAWRILVNTALTHYRKLKKSFGDVGYLDEILVNGEDDGEVGLKIENTIDREQEHAWVREAIDELPEEAASLLRAHYLEDKPYEEIAQKHGLTIGALKMKLFRARKVLKEIMDRP